MVLAYEYCISTLAVTLQYSVEIALRRQINRTYFPRKNMFIFLTTDLISTVITDHRQFTNGVLGR
jgi:hypothetical protein